MEESIPAYVVNNYVDLGRSLVGKSVSGLVNGEHFSLQATELVHRVKCELKESKVMLPCHQLLTAAYWLTISS